MNFYKQIFMFFILICCNFLTCFVSFAADYTEFYDIQYISYASNNLEGSSRYRVMYVDGQSKVYSYHSKVFYTPSTSGIFGQNIYGYYLSESPFTLYLVQNDLPGVSSPERPGFNNRTKFTSSFDAEFGYYYYPLYQIASYVNPLANVSLPGSIFLNTDPWGKFWREEGFVLGQGSEDPGGGGSSSSIVYDSTIPAPQNLKFEQKNKGFDFISGAKFEHNLTWSNGLATPPLGLRVSAVANVVFDDTGQTMPDSMLHLVEASENGVKADVGRFSIAADELKSKVLQGTTLTSVVDYRVQFYRYGDDGKLTVGPISTIHLNYNMFGKYTGYTVTTDTPKDGAELGPTGGMDDFYQDNWTADGEDYYEYDKDGNLTDSGKTEEGNIFQKLLNALTSVPKIINSFFDSLLGMMSGVGQVPTYLSQLFSFLPSEIISLVGLGVGLVVCLRILGR